MRIIHFTFLILFCWTGSVFGGGRPVGYLLVNDEGVDVFVATIERVDGEISTNGKAPKVELQVIEILRGNSAEVVLPHRFVAQWMPPVPEDADTTSALRDWESKPFQGHIPVAGQTMIFVGAVQRFSKHDGKGWFSTGKIIVYAEWCRPFSEEERTRVLEVMYGRSNKTKTKGNSQEHQ